MERGSIEYHFWAAEQTPNKEYAKQQLVIIGFKLISFKERMEKLNKKLEEN